ncbi:MAG: SIS domain-containing protein [bacterium]
MSIFDDDDDEDDPADLADLPEEPLVLDGELLDGDADIVAVLDSQDAVAARDPGRMLWLLATAGAQVRRAVETVERWSPETLSEDIAPRSLLIVTDPSASLAASVLAELAGERVPVIDWRGAQLPRWAGPTDVLLAADIDGRHSRVADLVAEGDRRGLRVVAVAPERSPVAAAAARSRLVPIEPVTTRRVALWTLLAPLLLAADALGVASIGAQRLIEVADALDTMAEACRPSSDAFTNPAKQLAVELAESEAMIAGVGPLSAIAARWMGSSLAVLAGLSATTVELPDDIAVGGALLEIPPSGALGATTDPDFFRDRTQPEVTRRRRVVFVFERNPADVTVGRPAVELVDEPWPTVSPWDEGAERAAIVLEQVAAARGLVTSTVDTPARDRLARFAAATSFGDFAAAYAAIGRGVDPAAVRAGELPH